MVTKIATNLNGISLAYMMGVANTGLACLVAFGVHLSDSQTGALTAFLNAVLVLTVHLSHRDGEQAANIASGAAPAPSPPAPAPAPTEPAPPVPAVTG